MGSNRGARAGEIIKLRARFVDDLGDNALASSVTVSIFEPDTDIEDITEAIVVSGSANSIGQGIFEYQYAIPATGPDGTWYDIWAGALTGQDLSGEFNFEVSASGVISQVSENQLYNNNLVQITLTSGIRALDGGILEDEWQGSFLTTTSPAYTSIRKVELAAGGFLNNIEDDVIQLAILEGSLEANALTFAVTTFNNAVYQHARREYVTCLVARTLTGNMNNSLLKSKTLDNLSVQYDTNGIRDMLVTLDNCLSRWESQLISGGGAKAGIQPRGVVKGEFDPDRPVVSRIWQSTEEGGVSRRIPAANTQESFSDKRRSLRTWRKPRWW